MPGSNPRRWILPLWGPLCPAPVGPCSVARVSSLSRDRGTSLDIPWCPRETLYTLSRGGVIGLVDWCPHNSLFSFPFCFHSLMRKLRLKERPLPRSSNWGGQAQMCPWVCLAPAERALLPSPTLPALVPQVPPCLGPSAGHIECLGFKANFSKGEESKQGGRLLSPVACGLCLPKIPGTTLLSWGRA